MALIVVPSVIGAFQMYGILPTQGIESVKIITATLFAVLFGWISVGFWMCAAGLWMTLKKVDRFSPTAGCDDVELAGDCRTAILFPVYNEDSKKYMAGIAATWHSLVETGQADAFDIFILSDDDREAKPIVKTDESAE